MNATAVPLSAAAAGLRFHRVERIRGALDAQVTAKRDILFSDGEVMFEGTDSVTFRVVPVDRYDADKGRDERVGWQCIVFANSQVIHDDHGRECGSQALAKAYLRRLADDEYMKELAMRAMLNEGDDVWKQTIRHDAFMAAMDDHYGRADRDR